MQKLIDLMRSDITKDAAVPLPLKEPRRAGFQVLLVRPDTKRLDDTADCAAKQRCAAFRG